MRIAILGGTGAIGEGLALRWSRDASHEVLVGSRDADRARRSVEAYGKRVTQRDTGGSLSGLDNQTAADRAEVIVLSVPPYYIRDTIRSIEAQIGDALLISPAVGFDRDQDGFHYDPPAVGSLTALADRTAPEGTPVVGTFHNLPASRLADMDADLGLDTPVVADDEAAKETVISLVNDIDGLRGVDAGSMANAPEVEGLVPLLLNVAENTELDDVGIRFA